MKRQKDLGSAEYIQLPRTGAGHFLVAEQEPSRLALFAEDDDGELREVCAVGVHSGAELEAFIGQLRALLGTSAPEVLDGEAGPLEPFQPPPEEPLPEKNPDGD